ncbi:hypothetical protein K7X08_006411 [Anisodus acutangulus]|uniref:Uncharacterized protein n=1 Tax=Anisodus acutangulus TaxID=402998 RepID=A0A9Q1RRL3_9SOLA|nr:hypothetical protein K7X08_006411 [Anisodus acutangulus]
MVPQLKSSPCSQFQHVCNGATAIQLAVLFSSFGFMSLGTGFVRPCSIIFGADQLGKKESPDGQRLIASYFNCCLNRACMIQHPQRDLNPDGSVSNPWSLCSVEHVEPLKALLRVLPMCSTGVAEAAHTVGQIEFFYCLLTKSISSMASAMYTIGTAVSSLVGSVLVSGVDWLSSTGGKTSGLSSNINRAHLDYYFWLLTFLCLLNFFYFLGICRFYEPGNDGSSLEAEERECDYRILPES